jgi:hypothetical protein
MSALWTNDGAGWKLLDPVGFPSEATLHDLIEEEPGLLPLSGAPQVVVLGRGLASGAADLVAVEMSGRPVFIEVKLERNPEARRAVVAQVLSYAASVYGLDLQAFENELLGRHLRARDLTSIADAVRQKDDAGVFDADDFRAALAESLATGAARLVLVLDAAPPELTRLAAYLEAVSARLVIDLVAVSVYEVGGQRVIVPQRVDPGREREERVAVTARRSSGSPGAQYFEGSGEFVASIEKAPVERQPVLGQLLAWAEGLEREGLASLATTIGKSGGVILRVRVPGQPGGPVTIWNAKGADTMQIWGSVLRRRAPGSIEAIELALAPKQLKYDTWTTPEGFTPELLAALARAYREAVGVGSMETGAA